MLQEVSSGNAGCLPVRLRHHAVAPDSFEKAPSHAQQARPQLLWDPAMILTQK